MPTNPAIRAALEAAAREYCYADGECPCATPTECRMVLAEVRLDAAAAIAAFLRALAAAGPMRLPGDDGLLLPYLPASLAAAVEEAARDA